MEAHVGNKDRLTFGDHYPCLRSRTNKTISILFDLCGNLVLVLGMILISYQLLNAFEPCRYMWAVGVLV